MSTTSISCTYCKKNFLRSLQRINENTKLNQKQYCSNRCVSASNRKPLLSLICENELCSKVFMRRKYELSLYNYCSSTCASIVNSKKYPRHPGIRKNCAFCKKEFISREKYCSTYCQYKGYIVPKESIIAQIQKFYEENGRIPLKREFAHPRAARERFGSWNKAIIATGFIPNPVMFAKRYIAKDGHVCDSLAEVIIDDWFYKQQLHHERRIAYPGNAKLTVDFVIKDYWIEFFGLVGQHRRYDELRAEKLLLAKKHNLNLIGLYPKDIFPKNRLAEIFT